MASLFCGIVTFLLKPEPGCAPQWWYPIACLHAPRRLDEKSREVSGQGAEPGVLPSQVFHLEAADPAGMDVPPLPSDFSQSPLLNSV